MKPFSKHGLSDEEKIFNYRTSRARRVSENAFGILAWRFRVFSKAIELKPDTIDRVILAACSLHNWLRKTSQATICHKMHWTEKILTQEK
ncbi:nuclease harbi1-like protein [Trichonephila clavipes]|nr:nuclease harbi1-like protein [Trichonephila clavipes]